ncbi:MAG: CHAT domain-containing protein [bacterium]|nr:CHAT domain-containing protein [bacterium]
MAIHAALICLGLAPLAAAQDPPDPGALHGRWSELLPAVADDPAREHDLVEAAWALLAACATQPDHGIDLTEVLGNTFKVVGSESLRGFLLPYLITDLQSRNRTQEAHAILDGADARLDELAPDASYRVALLYLRAGLYLREGRPDRALPPARRAFELAQPLKANAASGSFVNAAKVLSDAYLSTERHEQVIALLRPILEERVAGYGALRISAAFAYMELSAVRAEHRADARRLFEDVAPDSQAAPLDRLHAFGRLALLDLDAERPRAALEHLAAARELPPGPVADAAFRAALEHQALSALGEPTVTQADALLAHVTSLLDEWHGLGAPPGGIGFLRHLRERLFLVEFLELVAQREGDAAAFARLNEIQALSTLARELDGDAGELDEIARRLVPANGTLLSLVYGRTRMLAFLVTAAGDVELFAHNAGVELIGDAREYQLGIMRPLSPVESVASSTRGRVLTERIFSDELRRRLARFEELVLVGGEVFAELAFESLPVVTDRPLGVDRVVWRLPSVPVGLGIARRQTWQSGELDLLIVTNATPSPAALALDGELRSVDLSAREVAQLAGPFSSARSVTLLDGKASRSHLARALGRRPAVVHIFAHGIVNPLRVIPSGFVLSATDEHDGLFFAEDVEELHWPPLVLLSVCGAARGPERVGDAAAADLRGAFLRAGARCVVVSTANLQRSVTRDLTARLTRELARGRSVGEALRLAREEIFDDPRTDDPYYHSLLQAFGPPAGAWNRPAQERSPSFWLLLAVPLGAALVWRLRRR